MEGLEDPLDRRTTGRRSRRRQERVDNHRENENEENDDQSSESSQEEISSSIAQPIRRPRAEIESQIDAAIEARRKQQQMLVTHNDAVDDDDDDDIILGDYEYLDHTADVQLHSWGDNLEQALENLVPAMFGYMTKLRRINLAEEREVTVQAHDATSLVFVFLQEWLSIFHETGFVAKQVQVTNLSRETNTITALGTGEMFDASRHSQGTEVKAVTYSNLQVVESSDGDQCDIWVIVDI